MDCPACQNAALSEQLTKNGVVIDSEGILQLLEPAEAEVEATGWFRRAPVPYLEIKTLKVDGRQRRCYAYHAKLITASAVVVIGLVVATVY